MELIDFIKNIFQKEMKKVRTDKKKQFAYFVIGFVFAYLLLNFFAGVIPQESYKQITGIPIKTFFSVVGFNVVGGELVECTENGMVFGEYNSKCYSFGVNNKKIIISWLCSGILEIIILLSALLASFGISFEKKLKGVVLAVLTGFVFNQARIILTILIITSQSTEIVELAHDLLFRIMLFAYITVFYVAWFWWAESSKKK